MLFISRFITRFTVAENMSKKNTSLLLHPPVRNKYTFAFCVLRVTAPTFIWVMWSVNRDCTFRHADTIGCQCLKVILLLSPTDIMVVVQTPLETNHVCYNMFILIFIVIVLGVLILLIHRVFISFFLSFPLCWSVICLWSDMILHQAMGEKDISLPVLFISSWS